MVSGNIVLSSALRDTLLSVNRTERTIDDITLRLASGLSVNSALDAPDNFFTAQALRQHAGDHTRLLDGIGQSIRSLQTASQGVEALNTLIDQAESIVTTSKEFLEAGEVDPAVYEEFGEATDLDPLNVQIINDVPVVYYRLNETSGSIQDTGFSAFPPLAAQYDGATPNAVPLYSNGSAPSVDFDGIDDRIRVSNTVRINSASTTARTVELVFNADSVNGRQILYEEGSTISGFTIYIDDGLLRVTAEDGVGGLQFADIDLSTSILAGETYHVAFVFSAASNSLEGFLDGISFGSQTLAGGASFPGHTGGTGIGGMNDGAQFHDGEDGANAGYNFDGRISDVAVYNVALDEAELKDHADSLENREPSRFRNADYENVIEQITHLVEDAGYRGINLLGGDNLITNFNRERTSTLHTQGQDFSADGLGLSLGFDFNDLNDVNRILESVRAAKDVVRNFGFTLSNDLSIIQMRETFTLDKINSLEAGADDLTLADANAQGANLLASQTRLTLGTTALSLAAISQVSVLTLFG